MEYLEKANVFDKAELLRKVNREYDFLSRIEKCNLGIEGVKKYLELVNKYNDRNAKIFLELEFYKNVNMIGKGLIDEYEKENMLDDLEENMSLNKNEILRLDNYAKKLLNDGKEGNMLIYAVDNELSGNERVYLPERFVFI